MNVRVLNLTKGRQTYVFRYSRGREDEVVNEIIRLAEDPGTDLDWVDAATLGYQITQHIAADCYRQMDPRPVKAREGPCSHSP